MYTLLDDDNLKIRFLGMTGLVTFTTDDSVYLCDIRMHSLSLLFPSATFISKLKVYKIEGEPDEKSKPINKISIPWSLIFVGSLVGKYFANWNFNINVLDINRTIIIMGTFFLILLKYFFHFYNLRKFENKQRIKLSNTEIKYVRLKYKSKRDQNKYYLTVLIMCLAMISLVLMFGLSAYFWGSPIATPGFFTIFIVYVYFAPGARINSGEKYLEIQ